MLHQPYHLSPGSGVSPLRSAILGNQALVFLWEFREYPSFEASFIVPSEAVIHNINNPFVFVSDVQIHLPSPLSVMPFFVYKLCIFARIHAS